MKCVDVCSLASDMTLAQPVYNHQGDLMFEVGSAVTDKEVRVLKSWGIEKIWVAKDTKENVSIENNATEEDNSRPSSGNTLEGKFTNVLNDPVMAEIMRVAKKIQERRHSKLDWSDGNR